MRQGFSKRIFRLGWETRSTSTCRRNEGTPTVNNQFQPRRRLLHGPNNPYAYAVVRGCVDTTEVIRRSLSSANSANRVNSLGRPLVRIPENCSGPLRVRIVTE